MNWLLRALRAKVWYIGAIPGSGKLILQVDQKREGRAPGCQRVRAFKGCAATNGTPWTKARARLHSVRIPGLFT